MTIQIPPQADVTFADIAEVHRAYGPVMKAIAAAVGDHCEVVLHNLTKRDLKHSIYAIENGHVTGRDVGGPSTNLGFQVMQDESADHDEFGYRGLTADGRELHSSSIYLRNHDGHIIAALCINVDLSPVQSALSVLRAYLPSEGAAISETHEVVAPDIGTVLDQMIAEAIDAGGKPVALMGKTDRVDVMRYLDSRGAFHVKKAADIVATRLGVSRVTAYGYLDEARRSSR